MESRRNNIKNKKFNSLTALEYSHKGYNGYSFWKFKCDCGKIITVSGSLVWRNRIKSCGCLLWETRSNSHKTHGYKYSRIYRIWQSMLQRCYNKTSTNYCNYGKRNIKVCNRWKNFINFLADMKEPPSSKHTIDRIDNNKGYTPKNCRWATPLQQNRNSGGNLYYTLYNKTYCLSEWAEIYEKPYRLVWDRVIRCGWPLKRALTESIHIEKRR